MIGEIRIAEHYIHSRLIAISLVACNTIFANKFFIVVSHFVRSTEMGPHFVLVQWNLQTRDTGAHRFLSLLERSSLYRRSLIIH
jgi:hypothetical protein